jgi:hypothetical protein
METEQASYHQLLAGWRPAGQPLGRRAGRWRFLLARRVKERKAGEGWRAGGHGRKRKGKKAERRKGSGRVRRALKNPPVGCRFCFGGRARCSLLGMGWRGGETGPALRRAATRSELGAGGAVTRAAIVRVCGARGTGLVRLPGAEGGAVAAGGVVRLDHLSAMRPAPARSQVSGGSRRCNCKQRRRRRAACVRRAVSL